MLDALTSDPNAWKYVLEAGPEAIDELIANSDEAMILLKNSDIDGLKGLMEGGEVIADSTKKVISDIAELGLDSPENISRVEKLKACGAADEDIIKVIEEGTPSSTYMQKKILELDDFNYLDDKQKLAIKSAINDGRVDVSTWTGQLSGDLKGLTTEEWAAVNRYMGNGSDVYRIPENHITQVGDFIVDGVKIEFKGLYADNVKSITKQALEYAKDSYPIDGKNVDNLVLDCVSNGQDISIDQATEIANIVKAKYPDKTIEIWTSYGEVVK